MTQHRFESGISRIHVYSTWLHQPIRRLRYECKNLNTGYNTNREGQQLYILCGLHINQTKEYALLDTSEMKNEVLHVMFVVSDLWVYRKIPFIITETKVRRWLNSPFRGGGRPGRRKADFHSTKNIQPLQTSVPLSNVYGKSEGKIFQVKIQARRHITQCQRYDLYQTEITIKI